MPDFETWCEQHEDRHDRQDRVIDTMQEAIRELRDDLTRRLPVWATIAISILAAAVGWFAK